MTDKELKHLSRRELLGMLIVQMKENEKLKRRLKEAEKVISSRRIAIEQSGTMAEAALRLSGVFEAADQAVNQYLENIRYAAEKEKDKGEEKAAAEHGFAEYRAASDGAASSQI